jgi:hypothetical protein
MPLAAVAWLSPQMAGALLVAVGFGADAAQAQELPSGG